MYSVVHMDESSKEHATLDAASRIEQDAILPVEPLTHHNADGVVYQRDTVVERQIAEALGLPADRLQGRAMVSDQGDPGYLKEECLVYLIRHQHRAGERSLVSALAEALLRRCAKKIKKHLNSLGTEAVEEGYSDVVEQLFSRILDLDSDRGDFLQVRFWPALEKLAVRAYDRQLKLNKRAQRAVPISSLAGYDHDEDDESERVVRSRGGLETASPSIEAMVIGDDLIREALDRIEEPYRSAFLLKYHAGWPIEDQDPNVQTISRQFGKDPRTIRNWIKKAKEDLELWRGEQQ